jgi:hypothetical protein
MLLTQTTSSPSTAGSVSHTGVIPGLGSNLAKVGNNVAHGYAPYSASKALSDAFNSYSAGVMIPGLGAPCKPLAHAVSSAQNSKTVVASPGNNPQSPMAEPLTRMADLVHPQPQARASINSLGAIVAQEVKPSAVAGTQPDALATDQSDTADHVMPDASPDFKEQDAAKKYVRPSGEPEVWRQQQSSTSFKLQSMTRSSESFFGACVLLAGLNSEFYTMPYGVSNKINTSSPHPTNLFCSLEWWPSSSLTLTMCFCLFRLVSGSPTPMSCPASWMFTTATRTSQ